MIFFSQQNGKPFSDNQRYEGCFINYPDVDMRYISNQPGTTDTRWLELYYGDKVNMLINTKRAVDPENIFRREMSIPVSHP
ncbi:BBE domain-containing protein [Erwinia tasmaniensis]|uniref:BBE domain-containing protein n=1 Tax=Erwinia tasmaniensis TaxID=338565 RepID=UPI003A4DD657